MGPRRGVGSSGGGGGGGDDGGGFSDSPWGASIYLDGSNFKDPVARGSIIVNGIFLIALLAVAIWSVSFRKFNEGNRKVFKSYRYGLAMFAVLISFGINLASSIIRDVVDSVAAIYLLIEDILINFSFVAQIFLLITIYYLFSYCHRRSNAKPLPEFTKWIHAFVCIILFGLWVAMLYFSITFEVHVILLDQSYDELYKSLDIDSKISVAYSVLYLCAAIEILAWAVAISLSSQEQGNNDPVGAYLFGLVGIPLVIRSLWRLAINSSSLHHTVSDKVILAYLIFWDLCTVIIYAGIVKVATQLEKDTEMAGAFMGPTDQNPNQWQSQPLMHHGGKTPYQETGQALPYGPPAGRPPTHNPTPVPNGTDGPYWPEPNQHNGGYVPVSPEIGVNGTQPTSNQRGPAVGIY